METNNTTAPQGKGLAVTGFVLSLVGIIFAAIVFGIVAASMALGGGKGLAYFWIVLCLASVVLSVMGMMKLGKTGGKKGLAIAGMIIGIVALIWSVLLLMGLSAVESMKSGFGDEWNKAMDKAKEDMQNMADTTLKVE